MPCDERQIVSLFIIFVKTHDQTRMASSRACNKWLRNFAASSLKHAPTLICLAARKAFNILLYTKTYTSAHPHANSSCAYLFHGLDLVSHLPCLLFLARNARLTLLLESLLFFRFLVSLSLVHFCAAALRAFLGFFGLLG